MQNTEKLVTNINLIKIKSSCNQIFQYLGFRCILET